jgi:hypothetical protein
VIAKKVDYKFFQFHERVLLVLYTWYFSHSGLDSIPTLDLLLVGDDEFSELLYNHMVFEFSYAHQLTEKTLDEQRLLFLGNMGVYKQDIHHDCLSSLNATHHFFQYNDYLLNVPARSVW